MKRSDTYLAYLAAFFLGSECIKQLLLTYESGVLSYQVWYFPFQLCSLPIYLLPLYLLVCSEFIRTSILTFFSTYSLLGGFMAFCDTTGMQYQLKVLTIHSYLWHILLVLLGLYAAFLLKCRKTRPVHFLTATMIYLLSCLLAEMINAVLGPYGVINMFYINPKYWMGQIVFTDIAHKTSNTFAIALYILSTIFGSFLLELVQRSIINRKK